MGWAQLIPFDANAFDLLYNGYMLGLIPENEMPDIRVEFCRVLLPGGWVVLLIMSMHDQGMALFHDKLDQLLPASLALYLIGGCWLVLIENAVKKGGISHIQCSFVDGKAPSEIVLATESIVENCAVIEKGKRENDEPTEDAGCPSLAR